MTIDWLYQADELKPFPVIGKDVVLYPGFLENPQADTYLHTLLGEIRWQKETITMYGNAIEVPRLVAWYGDTGSDYRYSNINHSPESWTPVLRELKEKVERLLNADFNSVLLNLYRDGNDSVAWHSDDESELGKNPVIASLSLGAERDFQLRKKSNPSDKRVVRLPHGSLLLMSGPSQRDWVHQLPKRRNVNQPRINLTFRKIN